MKKPLILIILVLILDQVLKIWIKTNLHIGEEINLIGDWCKIHFVENNGMAFGMAFGGSVGKILLTLFRIVASVLIFIYFRKLIIKNQSSKLTIYSLALIFAGAVGNIIDSIFYGVIFSESTFFNIAQMFPSEGGYSSYFLGKVVDMFYFPIIDTTFPEWMPMIGGDSFRFFNAIFNLADVYISIGVVLLVVSLWISNRKEPKKREIGLEVDSQKTDKF